MKEKVYVLLAAIIAAVFVVAGSMKILNSGDFFVDIQNYDLLPWNPVTVALAFYLPWLELVCGVALFFRQFRRGALVLILALLLVFIGALVSAWIRGLDISCGCFVGQTEHSRYLLWIIRDVPLLLATAGLIFFERHWKAWFKCSTTYSVTIRQDKLRGLKLRRARRSVFRGQMARR